MGWIMPLTTAGNNINHLQFCVSISVFVIQYPYNIDGPVAVFRVRFNKAWDWFGHGRHRNITCEYPSG
jgi:hypothetical protein